MFVFPPALVFQRPAAVDVTPDGATDGSELPARAVPTFPVKEQMADWKERQTIMEEKIGDLERENVWLKRLRGENTDALKSKTSEINVLKKEVAAVRLFGRWPSGTAQAWMFPVWLFPARASVSAVSLLAIAVGLFCVVYAMQLMFRSNIDGPRPRPRR